MMLKNTSELVRTLIDEKAKAIREAKKAAKATNGHAKKANGTNGHTKKAAPKKARRSKKADPQPTAAA